MNVVVGFVQQGLLLSSKDHRNDGFGRPARGSAAQTVDQVLSLELNLTN